MAETQLSEEHPQVVEQEPTPVEQPSVVLDVHNLSVRYGGYLALNDVSLEVPQGQIIAVIGASGGGKSTFLRGLNRMNELLPGVQTSGKVLLNGENIYGPTIDPVAVRWAIGMVFQKPNPFPKSIKDNVAFGLKNNPDIKKSEYDDEVERALRQAALWDEVKNKLKSSALSLSGGQQQRLCIARALAVKPAILLMDEPCSSLDPIATLKIEELMANLTKPSDGEPGTTIVIVTHAMEQAARVSHLTAHFGGSAVVGVASTLIEIGPTEKMFSNPRDQRTEDYIAGRFG